MQKENAMTKTTSEHEWLAVTAPNGDQGYQCINCSLTAITLWHRIRFYEGKWSTFDGVEKCVAPGSCFLCDTKHPFCTETGRVLQCEGAKS